MSKIYISEHISFEIKKQQSIVDAALAAGLFFPHSCRTGRCGSCKCFVSSGKTEILFNEESLHDRQRDEGWILGCARTASEDILLNGVEVNSFNLPKSLTLPCRITSIEKLSADILKVELRLPPKLKLKYIEGQYIEIIKNDIRRSYSIANAPNRSDTLELHIKRIKSGIMSDYWFLKAETNDLLRLNGPHGTFFLREFEEKNLVFLATGTGFAPIKAMLESLKTANNIDKIKSIRVYHGVKSSLDLYCQVPKISYPINYTPVISRDTQNWGGACGHIQDQYLSTVSDLSNTDVYACGSNAMISEARDALTQAGLNPSKFFSDAFVQSG